MSPLGSEGEHHGEQSLGFQGKIAVFQVMVAHHRVIPRPFNAKYSHIASILSAGQSTCLAVLLGKPRIQPLYAPVLLTTIREMDGVKEVYGRRSVFDVSAKLNDDTNFSGTVDLISYDDFDLQCLKKDSALKRGSDLSKVFGDSNFVLATSDQDSTWKIGDTVQIGDETLTIAGLLKNDPFSENGLTNGKLTLITSDETFVRLTGEEGYSLVLIQTTGDVTDENVQAIQNSVDQTYSFRDKRDERTTGTYMAFVFCVYAFLAIIALVTVMNIVNSISMSVSARMKQYGAMRAVGMDERQMTKMIACEAFTYAVLGCVVGCAIGLPLSKTLGEKDIYYIFTPLMPNTSTRIVLKKPKTDSSIRKVWLPKTLAYILREWKKSQDELKGFLGDEYQDFDLVVALPNGRPCEDRIILKEFAKLREDAGLPKVVFHSLRHSSTTYKLKLNHGDLKATQGDTGHAEIDMITSIYAHILDEDRKVNAQKFETAFYAKLDLRNVRPPEEPAKSEPATLDLESLVEQLQKSPELASALAALIAAQAPAK